METLWNGFIDLLPGNWELFREWPYWRFLLEGLWLSARIAIYSIILSLLIGISMSVLRLAPARPVRWVATAYIESMRATPVLLLLFFVFFGASRFPTGWAMDVPIANLFVDENNGDLTPMAPPSSPSRSTTARSSPRSCARASSPSPRGSSKRAAASA